MAGNKFVVGCCVGGLMGAVLVVVAMVFALDTTKVTSTPPPDQSAKVAELQSSVADLQGKLEASKTALRISQADFNYSKQEVESLQRQSKEKTESVNTIIATLFDPKGFMTKLSDEAGKLMADVDTDLVVLVRTAAGKAFGRYGESAVIWSMDKLAANPAMARIAYSEAKPVIIPMARMLNIRFDKVSVLVTKQYDPFIGAIAATEGHYCRYELAVESKDKSEKCNKVFARISAYYDGVALDESILKTLGVMHRRYLVDESPTHDGFIALRYIAQNILEEVKKE